MASAGALSNVTVAKLPPSCAVVETTCTPEASRSTKARPPCTVTRNASAPAAIETNILRPFSLPPVSAHSPARSMPCSFSCHAGRTIRSPLNTGPRWSAGSSIAANVADISGSGIRLAPSSSVSAQNSPTPRPEPPASSATNRPGQPMSHIVRQTSRSKPGSVKRNARTRRKSPVRGARPAALSRIMRRLSPWSSALVMRFLHRSSRWLPAAGAWSTASLGPSMRESMGTSPAASLCASLGDLPQRARDHSFSATEEPESGMNDNVTTEQPTPEQAIPEQPTPEGEAQRELIGWEPELLELRHRQALAREMGGPERVERQHKGGRLTVRERIDRLLDAGTFQEIGSIAGKAWYDAKGNITEFMPGNCVFGRGKLAGRPVVAAGDDFTLRGGSADASIKGKPKMSEQLAMRFRMPIIRLIEGSGGGGSVKTIETTGRANLPGGLSETTAFDIVANNMAEVPVVGLGLGSVAGLGAARLVAAHYSVMVKEIAAVFVAGPPVVERLGEPRTKQELGGWQIQLRCGAVDHAVDTEAQAFEAARRFLSYLLSSIHEVPPRIRGWDDPQRRDESLISAIPKVKKQAYH